MYVRNVESQFNSDELFYCYSPALKKFLCKNKNIIYVSKGVDDEKKKYWIFFKTDNLLDALNEFDEKFG